MRHFGIGQWTDFVRGLASADEQAQMSKHLEDGCETCLRVVESLQKVVSAAGSEEEADPPSGAVRKVRGLVAEDEAPESEPMELVWDSALAPFLLDKDGSEEGGRQLHFSTGEFELNARVEQASGAVVAVLIGRFQSKYQVSVTDLKVSLLADNRVIDTIYTGAFGEFELALADVAEADVELWISLDERMLVAKFRTEIPAPASGDAGS